MVAPAVGDRAEISAGAERAAGARQHGHRDRIVAVELDERVVEQSRRRAVDGVANRRSLDGDDSDGAVVD